MDIKAREKAITKTSVVGIIANCLLVGMKAVAGLIAGSIAIVLDALNNLTDALSSVITIIGIKLSKRKPNHKHPYGYGRIEYFSAILVALLVLSAGVTAAIESVKKIIAPEIPDYSVVTIIIVVASVLCKLALGFFVKKQGKKYNSDALTASGADASFDAIISASTLIGAIVTYFCAISIDGYIGVIISVFIIKAGLEMLFGAIGQVLGNRVDSEITKEIKAAVVEIPGVIGAYDLVLHNYGPNAAIGSIHVEVAAEMTAGEIHQLTMRIQNAMLKKFHIFFTVGIYAVDTVDQAKIEMRENVIRLCCGLEGTVNTHGVYVDHEEKYMSFDVTADFSVTDKEAFYRKIVETVRAEYPDYDVRPNLDTNYSD